MSYGLEHFKLKTIYEGNTTSQPIFVRNAKPERGKYFEDRYIETVVAGDRPVEMMLADWEKAEVVQEQVHELAAPIRAGQIVGKVEIFLNDTVISHYDVICTEDILAKKFGDTLQYLRDKFLFVELDKK